MHFAPQPHFRSKCLQRPAKRALGASAVFDVVAQDWRSRASMIAHSVRTSSAVGPASRSSVIILESLSMPDSSADRRSPAWSSRAFASSCTA